MAMPHIPPRSHGSRVLRAKRSVLARGAVLPIEQFIHSEIAGALLLFTAACIALIWANSPWSSSYFAFWKRPLMFDLGVFSISKDLRHWINDGLMAIFFFVVGLEIKRELVHGELSTFRQAALPAVAALGGMLAPALIYSAWNLGTEGSRGWGIPMATDIAFALGAMALLGKRIPSGARLFLLALAIVDDLGAILVIALFYTEHLSLPALAVALLLIGVLFLLQRLGAGSSLAFGAVGVLFWIAVLKSGVHPTVAGVILGFLVPVDSWFSHATFAETAESLLDDFRLALRQNQTGLAKTVLGQFEELARGTEAQAERLERKVHPWVSYLVLPLFALANAGVVLSAGELHARATNAVTLGIVFGLVAGKVVGVTGFSWAAVHLRISALPAQMRWPHLIGTGLLAGIGFTVSLFITGLAFENEQLIANAKIGILLASLLAGVLGFVFLLIAGAKRIRAR